MARSEYAAWTIAALQRQVDFRLFHTPGLAGKNRMRMQVSKYLAALVGEVME